MQVSSCSPSSLLMWIPHTHMHSGLNSLGKQTHVGLRSCWNTNLGPSGPLFSSHCHPNLLAPVTCWRPRSPVTGTPTLQHTSQFLQLLTPRPPLHATFSRCWHLGLQALLPVASPPAADRIVSGITCKNIKDLIREWGRLCSWRVKGAGRQVW